MINLAILGYGVVGSGVAEVCRMNQNIIQQRTRQELRVSRILDIRSFPDDPFADLITDDPDLIFNDPAISVVVETIGGSGIAYELTRRALKSGKHVVTSNKELVARFGPELMQLASDNKVSYMFEASVGGGIPIVRPLHKCLAANIIPAISGILNGTTNYVLTRMGKDQIDFEEALAEAQAKGYAEQNPAADIDGIDACRKIAILCSITLGRFIDSSQVYCEGISHIRTADMIYAADLDCKIKLIGRFRMNTSGLADIIVAPMLLPQDHPLAMADGVFNAIMVEGNALGEAMFYGRGAGKMPTASAVVADVIDCVMHLDRIPHMIPWEKTTQQLIQPHHQCPVRALVRLKADLQPAQIEKDLAAYGFKWLKNHQNEELVFLVGQEGNLTESLLDEWMNNHKQQLISRIRMF